MDSSFLFVALDMKSSSNVGHSFENDERLDEYTKIQKRSSQCE